MPRMGGYARGRDIGRFGSPSMESQRFVWADCVFCGKGRWVRFSVSSGQPINIACISCRAKARVGVLNPNWRGGPEVATCQECGIVFERPRAWMKKSGTFCSNSCEMVNQRKRGCFNVSPNNPEKALIALLEQQKLPFKFVGNSEVWLGNHNPDFINVNGSKQVIELFGIYWHPVFDVAKWKEHYRQYGFACLIVWEDELGNEPKLIKKLKRFTRVSHEVATHISI